MRRLPPRSTRTDTRFPDETRFLSDLKEAIAAKTLRDSGLDVAPGQVLVTNGGKHAVYNTFATLLDPCDEVLLPAPYWTTYPEPIGLSGGVPVVARKSSRLTYSTYCESRMRPSA